MTENIKEIKENTEIGSEALTPEEDVMAEPERVIIFEEALEAILFAAGHPVTYAKIAEVLDMTPAKVKDKVFEYSIKYNDMALPRGVMLLTFNDSCQLCTKQYYLPEIRAALGIKKSGSLSSSSLEALAIVAYNQPVTRVFVDTLRRVDSSYAMNNLIDRGLIESKGRMDAPGRPMLYGTTKDFLRCFGLKDLAELPSTTDELMEVFDRAKIADGASETAEEETKEEQITLDNDIENAPQIEIALDESSDEQEESEDSFEPSADDDVVNSDD